MPAVLRPALSSVTRRTLTSALQRDRSISLCKLRTCFRSPSRDAVKIRCRNAVLPARPWPSPPAPSRAVSPFAVAVATASNMPVGSALSSPLSPQAHPTRVSQRPFRPGHPPYPAGYRGGQQEDQPSAAVSRCLSATGIRFPGHPYPAGDISLPRSRPTGGGIPHHCRTPSGLPRSAHARCDRIGCLSTRDGGAHPAGSLSPPPEDGNRPPSTGPSYVTASRPPINATT